jgi:hypothetical protein
MACFESASAKFGQYRITSAGRFAPLGPRGILVLDLANRISGLAKGSQHGLGEVDTFFVTFRNLVPRRAVPRTWMINERGFDGVCYDDKAVFWHSGSLLLSAITDCPNGRSKIRAKQGFEP